MVHELLPVGGELRGVRAVHGAGRGAGVRSAGLVACRRQPGGVQSSALHVVSGMSTSTTPDQTLKAAKKKIEREMPLVVGPIQTII